MYHFKCLPCFPHNSSLQSDLFTPSQNLLIFTQSVVDTSGRRHSVSIPLLPSARPGTMVLSIQRKRGAKEKSAGGVDCLTVSGLEGDTRKQRKLSRRQNSLPARKYSQISESLKSPAGSDAQLRRGSVKRPGKQGELRYKLSAVMFI